jgi:hypothetical protein
VVTIQFVYEPNMRLHSTFRGPGKNEGAGCDAPYSLKSSAIVARSTRHPFIALLLREEHNPIQKLFHT